MAKQRKWVSFINPWECQAWASKNYQWIFQLLRSDNHQIAGFKKLWLWGYENVLEGFICAGIITGHWWWTSQVREEREICSTQATRSGEGFHSEGVVVWCNLTVRLRFRWHNKHKAKQAKDEEVHPRNTFPQSLYGPKNSTSMILKMSVIITSYSQGKHLDD